MKSLHSFCKENNLAKSTVHRKAQELKIDTSKGLSVEDCDRLLDVFGITPVFEPEVLPPVEPAKSGGLVKYQSAQIIPSIDRPAIVPINPVVLDYDISEFDEIRDLNFGITAHNLEKMGAKRIAEMMQLGKLHGSQAVHAYSQGFAEKVNEITQ